MDQQQEQAGHSILHGSPLAALYEREALSIFAYILRRISTREDTEDILFEVFLAALEYETIAELAQEKQRAGLLRVAHNKVVDHHRYTARHLSVPLEDVSETVYGAEDAEPDQLYVQQEEYALRNQSSMPQVVLVAENTQDIKFQPDEAKALIFKQPGQCALYLQSNPDARLTVIVGKNTLPATAANPCDIQVGKASS